MEMGVVPGGGSIMVHLLKYEEEIRAKLSAEQAATQVCLRVGLIGRLDVCVCLVGPLTFSRRQKQRRRF
jgi:hypothetical protein